MNHQRGVSLADRVKFCFVGKKGKQFVAKSPSTQICTSIYQESLLRLEPKDTSGAESHTHRHTHTLSNLVSSSTDRRCKVSMNLINFALLLFIIKNTKTYQKKKSAQ